MHCNAAVLNLVVFSRNSASVSETSTRNGTRIVFEPRASKGHEARGIFMKSADLDEAEGS